MVKARPKVKKALPEKMCSCGAKFTPERKWQRFCSRECRQRDWSENHQRISLDDEESISHVVRKISAAPINSPLFLAVKSAVYSKVQQRKKKR